MLCRFWRCGLFVILCATKSREQSLRGTSNSSLLNAVPLATRSNVAVSGIWLNHDVLATTIGDPMLNHRLQRFCLRLMQASTGRVLSNRGGWQSNLLPVHVEPALSSLVQGLRIPMSKYLLGTSRGDGVRFSTSYVVTELWVNINGPGDFNTPHRHRFPGESKENVMEISGTYFVASGNSGPAHLRLICEDGDVLVKPVPGRLVMFPSDMEHSVQEHRNVSTGQMSQRAGLRISIAFNVEARWSRTELEAVAAKGDLANASRLSLGVQANQLIDAMQSAAIAGHLDVLEILLQRRAVLRTEAGTQPLHAAATAGHAVLISSLLQHRADIQASDDEGGRTAAHVAANKGHTAVLEQLEAFQASFTSTDSNGLLPIEWAIWAGHLPVVKYLSASGAGPDLGQMSAHLAANGHMPVMRFIVSKLPGRVHEADLDGMQPLHLAAGAGHKQLVALLLQARAAVAPSEAIMGRTPAHMAAEAGHSAVAQYLLARRAASDAVDVRGLRPEEAARAAGHASVATALSSWQHREL